MWPIHIDQVMRIQEQFLDIFQLQRRSRWVGGENGRQFEVIEKDRFGNLGKVIGVAAGGEVVGEELQVAKGGEGCRELEWSVLVIYLEVAFWIAERQTVCSSPNTV